MADKHWKVFERKAAKFFGTLRNSLSGMNSKVSASDSLHSNLFIECKHRARIALLTEYRKYLALAKKEKKVLVMVIGERGADGQWLLIKDKDLIKVALERQRAVKKESNEEDEGED